MSNSEHIMIKSATPRAQYTADGVQTLYTFPFPVFDASNLQVYIEEVLQVGTYSISGVGSSHGGSISFEQPPAAGGRITLRRLLPVERITDFQEGGDFRAASLNDELDYQTAALQQVQSDMERGLRLAPTDSDAGTTLPTQAVRAGKVLGFDTLGQPVALPASANLPDDASDKLVTGTGQITPRTLAERFAAVPTVLDQGAVGDGGTDDGAALSAVSSQHILPPGDYAVSATDFPSIRPYNLTGSGAIVDPNSTETSIRARHGLMNDRGTARSIGMLAAIMPDLAGPRPNIAALTDAIQSGSAKVVFVGDSIAEASVDIDEENSWVSLFTQSLERTFPDVAWSFENLSLGSRHAEHLASDSYLGLTSEPSDPDLGFFRQAATTFPRDSWRQGSVDAKSWRDHVMDEAPDLVVWALGMNNFQLSGQEYYSAITQFIDYCETWPKAPSIALATTFLPTRLDPTYSVRQAAHDGHYRIVRDVAMQRRLGLIDANRVFHYLRDGVDEGRRQWFGEADFRGWNGAWWDYLEGGAAQVSLNSDRLNFTGVGRPRRLAHAADFQADITWKPAHTADVLAFNYRVDPANSNDRYEFQWSGPNLKIYWKTTEKLTAIDSAAVVGSDNYVRVRCDGARHRVWVNGILKLDGLDFEMLAEGSCAFRAYLGSAAQAEIGCTLKLGYPARYARPLLHEDDLIGLGDWSTNLDSEGGNAINHPSVIGHYLIYGPATGAYITALKEAFSGQTVKSANSTSAISTTSTSFTGTGEQVTVYGKEGEQAHLSFNFHIRNQSPATNFNLVRIAQNGAQINETTQYVPPTDFRGIVLAGARIPVTMVAGNNTFSLEWLSENVAHVLESDVPGRSLTVERLS